jgi:hypothetical protein
LNIWVKKEFEEEWMSQGPQDSEFYYDYESGLEQWESRLGLDDIGYWVQVYVPVQTEGA